MNTNFWNQCTEDFISALEQKRFQKKKKTWTSERQKLLPLQVFIVFTGWETLQLLNTCKPILTNFEEIELLERNKGNSSYN